MIHTNQQEKTPTSDQFRSSVLDPPDITYGACRSVRPLDTQNRRCTGTVSEPVILDLQSNGDFPVVIVVVKEYVDIKYVACYKIQGHQITKMYSLDLQKFFYSVKFVFTLGHDG